MKHFFCIFILLLCFFTLSLEAKGAEDRTHGPVFSITKTFDNLDSFYKNISKEEPNYSAVTTDFGSLQIFAADSGTDDTKSLSFALKNSIQSGELSDIHLTLEKTENVKDVTFFYPIFDIQSSKGVSYQHSFALPFIVSLNQSGEAVSFDLLIQAQWCQDQICKPQTFNIPITMPSGKNYFSKHTAFIMNAFRYIPLTADNQQIQIHTLNQNSFWILVNMNKVIKQKPDIMLLDAKNHVISYTERTKKINKKNALFVLSTPFLDKIDTVIIKVNNKIYKKRMDMSFENIPEITTDASPIFFFPFYVWIIFLLISPAISLFIQLNIPNEIVARTILRNNIFGVFLGIASTAVIYSFIPYTYLINSSLWLIFCCITFAICILSQRTICSFGYGILTGIVPYFSLLSTQTIDVKLLSCSDYIVFFVILALINIVPFLVLWVKPIYAVRLSKYSRYQIPYIIKKIQLLIDFIAFIVISLV